MFFSLTKLFYFIGVVSMGLSIVASQVLFGGWWYPILFAPSLLLLASGAVFLGVSSLLGVNRSWLGNGFVGLSPWCFGSIFLFALYIFWRNGNSPDLYLARENTWLLLGGLGIYYLSSMYLRRSSGIWLFLGLIFLIGLVQVFLLLFQYTSQEPFHPLAGYALWFGLPTSESNLGVNAGFVTGTFASRGTLSSVLMISVFLSLGILVWGKTGVIGKLLLFWLTAALFVGLTLCLSRAAYLGVFGGLLSFVFLSLLIVSKGVFVHRIPLLIGSLGIIFLSLGFAYVIASESVAIQIRLGSLGDDSFREQIWFSTVPPMLELSPWIGTGANTFDGLSIRYRTSAIEGRPIHAHNDWLQLLVEYGWIGLGLAIVALLVHFGSAYRSISLHCQRLSYTGLLPQSLELGLLVGAFSAIIAQSFHSFFDYRLHTLSTVLLFAFCGAIIAGCYGFWSDIQRDSDYESSGGFGGDPRLKEPILLRIFGIVFSLLLAIGLYSLVKPHIRSEYQALMAENAFLREDLDFAWESIQRGLEEDPNNPRLFVLAAETAVGQANRLSDSDSPTTYKYQIERKSWLDLSSNYWLKAIEARPGFSYALREGALVFDWLGKPIQALPLHLRAIAQDPSFASGYESLGLHHWLLKDYESSMRLLKLAQRLPGSKLSRQFLPLVEKDYEQSKKKLIFESEDMSQTFPSSLESNRGSNLETTTE